MNHETVLIIEDEKELAQILGAYLEVEGFQVVIASDGEAGLTAFFEKAPNLVLLDIMLPKLDGMEVCKQIREKSDVPILMVSAKNGEMDKVISLGIGADDYVTKPFSPLELVARVKANLRRYSGSKNAVSIENDNKQELVVGKLILNKDSYSLSAAGIELNCTTKEFEILYFFASNQNQVFSKEQIYQNVWGYSDHGDVSSVTVYVKRIREKLAECNLDYIKTIWGVGYKLSIT